MTSIRCTVHSKPLPKVRPRFGKGRAYTASTTRGYETFLRLTFRSLASQSGWAPPLGEVEITLVLRFASGVHGDNDNCVKPIMDAAQGILMRNDKCVRDMHVLRRWADAEHPEGFDLTVTALADAPMPKRARKSRRARAA